MIRLVRAVTFSAAHRYHEAQLSELENQALYGSLHRANDDDGFGHNFRLEVHFEGPVDPLTGMIVNLIQIDAWLKALTERLDHQHLNRSLDFNGHAPTLERVAEHCLIQLREMIPGAANQKTSLLVSHVRLYEDDDLWVECF